MVMVFPGGTSGEESTSQCRRWKRMWVWSLGWEDSLEEGIATTPVFLPGESHRQRSLVSSIHGVTKSRTQLKQLSLPTQWLYISSVAQSCLTLCNPMDCSTPGFPVHHQLPELAETHIYPVGDAIQPSHPLPSPSPAFNLSQHQGLFQGVSSSHQVAKVLELQLQHQLFQWIFRTDFL